jgi:hypothetical protein
MLLIITMYSLPTHCHCAIFLKADRWSSEDEYGGGSGSDGGGGGGGDEYKHADYDVERADRLVRDRPDRGAHVDMGRQGRERGRGPDAAFVDSEAESDGEGGRRPEYRYRDADYDAEGGRRASRYPAEGRGVVAMDRLEPRWESSTDDDDYDDGDGTYSGGRGGPRRMSLQEMREQGLLSPTDAWKRDVVRRNLV